MSRPKKVASTEATTAKAKIAQSSTEVVMRDTVIHDGVTYKKGERVTLSPETVTHFLANKFASAVDVAVIDEGQNAATQSQEAEKSAEENDEEEEGEEGSDDEEVL